MKRQASRFRSRNYISLRGVLSVGPVFRGGGAAREALFPLTIREGSALVQYTVVVRGEGVDFVERVLGLGMPVVVEGRLKQHARSNAEVYPGVQLPIVLVEATEIQTAYPKRVLTRN